MERLTDRQRNFDGTASSPKSLVIEEGMRKGMPSAYCGAIVNKLADYEDAEEQGLLLKLPCPIGTTVYSIDRQIWIDEKGCRDCVYYAIDGSCDYEEEHPACTKVFETKFEFNMLDDFGKTVFLTKEEAEKALAERKNDE